MIISMKQMRNITVVRLFPPLHGESDILCINVHGTLVYLDTTCRILSGSFFVSVGFLFVLWLFFLP